MKKKKSNFEFPLCVAYADACSGPNPLIAACRAMASGMAVVVPVVLVVVVVVAQQARAAPQKDAPQRANVVAAADQQPTSPQLTCLRMHLAWIRLVLVPAAAAPLRFDVHRRTLNNLHLILFPGRPKSFTVLVRRRAEASNLATKRKHRVRMRSPL